VSQHTEVVAAEGLTAAQRAERGSFVGCIAGALSGAEYRENLTAVGFTDVEVEPTHQVAAGMAAAVVRARRRDVSPSATG